MSGNRFGLALRYILYSVLLICAVSCSGSGEPSSGTDHPGLGLPDYKLISKGDTGGIIPVDGISFVAEYGENNRPGENSANGYIIAPGGNDDLAWAEYRIDGLFIDRPVEIEIDVTSVIAPGGNDDLPLSFMIGVFNYTNFDWDWQGPFDETESLVLNSKSLSSRFVGIGCEFRFQVLTDCSGVRPSRTNPEGITAVEIIVSNVTVTDQYFTTAPHYTMLTDIEVVQEDPSLKEFSKAKKKPKPGSGVSVVLTWQHVEDLSDKKNEAKWYKVYRKLAGDSHNPKLLGKIDAPGTQFRDPEDVTSRPKKLVPGETYIYYLRSKNKSGETPYTISDPITIPDPGTITILDPPTKLKASDGKHKDKIELKWKKAKHADGYMIYRDNQSEPIATVGKIDKWNDTGVGDNGTHTYWLRSFAGDIASEFSKPDTGYLK